MTKQEEGLEFRKADGRGKEEEVMVKEKVRKISVINRAIKEEEALKN